jgi:hypothetical protein
MSSLQLQARSRVRITVVLGRGRHAAEAVRVRRGSIESDARYALRDWTEASEERYGEQFGSDTGRTLGAMIYFDGGEDRDEALAELDAALDRRLLERLRTRVSEPSNR